MKLNEKLAKKIIKAMFWDYDLEVDINIPDNDLIYFQIEKNNTNSPENNIITLFLEYRCDDIKILCNTRSEDYKPLGEYHIETDTFIKAREFWEVMFMEHLQ